MHENFHKQKYLIKKQFLKLFGGAFRIYDLEGNLCFYVEQKAFKLKEDIRVYLEEEKINEVLTIQARSIIDFSAAYDVIDTKSGQKIGALKRNGVKSILKDEWWVLGINDEEIAKIHEDSLFLATFRRFLTNLVPQSYEAYIGEKKIWDFKQNFNPFNISINLETSGDTEDQMDDRMAIAAAVLLCAIEGRQS